MRILQMRRVRILFYGIYYKIDGGTR